MLLLRLVSFFFTLTFVWGFRPALYYTLNFIKVG